jgi:hypothetical protein
MFGLIRKVVMLAVVAKLGRWWTASRRQDAQVQRTRRAR